MAPDAATRMKADGALSRIGTGRNIFSNLIGGAWIAALTLIITPMQVNILGMEAYGLVGFIMTLQMVFSVFDLGLSTTVTRELARDQSARYADTLPLLQTASTIYWILAIVLGAVLMVLAEPLAKFWFNPKSLDLATLEQGIRVIAIYLALRWPVALYSGILSGLRRMDILNAVKAVTSSIRLVGGIIVLYIMRDLESFLWWTAFSSLVEVAFFAASCYWIYPSLALRRKFSLTAIKRIWRSALEVNILSVVILIVNQTDRIIASKLLSLEDFGYFLLAHNVVAGIAVIVTAVSSATLPSFASLGGNDRCALTTLYQYSSSALLFLVGIPIFIFIFFGQTILELWVGSIAASNAYIPLLFLSIGFWIGAAVSTSHNLAVAIEMTKIPLKAYLLAIIPYSISIYFLIIKWGLSGAAMSWVPFFAVMLLLIVRNVHMTLLEISALRWFVKYFIPSTLIGILAFGSLRILIGYWYDTHADLIVNLLGIAISMLLYTVFNYMNAEMEVKCRIAVIVRSIIKKVHLI